MSVDNWDVFISYRRKDAAGLARWIRRRMLRFRLPAEIVDRLGPEAAALHARRPQIWLDTAYERPSDDFLTKKVFPALDNSRRLVVVSTPAAFEHLRAASGDEPNWLMREVDRFIAQDCANGTERPIDLVLGPGASDEVFPGALASKPRRDWVDLRLFGRRRWNPLDESLDAAMAKLIAGMYAIPDRDLPLVQRAERRQRTFWLVAALIASVLASVALLSLSLYAQSQTREATRQRNLAVARLLASEGYRVAQTAPDSAKAYFLSSLALAQTPNAISGLAGLVQRDPHAAMRFFDASVQPTALDARADGRVAIGLRDGSVALWSAVGPAATVGERALAGSAAPPRQLRGLGAPLIAIAQPQEHVMAIDLQGRLLYWDAAAKEPKVLAVLTEPGREIARRTFDNTPEASIAANGAAAAIPTYDGVVAWTATGGRILLKRANMAAGGPIALSDDGGRLAYPLGGDASLRVAMRIIDLRDPTREEIDVPAPTSGAGAMLSAAFAPDGRAFAAGTQNGFVQLWNLTPAAQPRRLLQHVFGAQAGAHEVVEHLHFSADARSLASRYGGAWQVWDVASGTPLGAAIVTKTPLAATGPSSASFLTVTQNTVIVHDYGIEHLRYVACLPPPTELSAQQWRDVAGEVPQVRLCGS